MRPLETTAMLAGFERRGPGTDAERRAARQLARELTAAGHEVRTESFWCRPNWALAHAWHVALALAGSLLSVSQPTVGAALLGAALLSVLADGLTGVSPGRRLTPERASQNVVARGSAQRGDHADQTRLIITANYDTGRTALVYRDALRRPVAWLRRIAGPLALGWLAWLSIIITWSLAVAMVRATEHHPPHALGAIQLPPTVALVLALALLLEASAAAHGPAAPNNNASGAAVAIALADALRAGPPRNLTIELVLQGAGTGHEIGMRRYLRTHRTALTSASTIVLGIAACAGDQIQHWLSDGRLIPLRYSRTLRELCSRLDAGAGYRGRGATPAFPARARGLPAIAIGCIDPEGESVDETALNRTLEFALVLVDGIDATLAPEPASSAAPATPA
jgi:hypothetical protein